MGGDNIERRERHDTLYKTKTAGTDTVNDGTKIITVADEMAGKFQTLGSHSNIHKTPRERSPAQAVHDQLQKDEMLIRTALIPTESNEEAKLGSQSIVTGGEYAIKQENMSLLDQIVVQ
jgi:hypothetical protein